jgi:hypothetical protein
MMDGAIYQAFGFVNIQVAAIAVRVAEGGE